MGTKGSEPGWSLRETISRPAGLALIVVVVIASAAISTVVSCNVHELTHAAVGTVVGWEVDQVFLCPGGARVTYLSTTDTWYGHAQGFAGGYGAAIFLVGLYGLWFVRRRRVLRGPMWWAAGLGMVAIAGPQLVIGTLEGVAGVNGSDYTDTIGARPWLWIPTIGLSAVAVAAVHARTWRTGKTHHR